MLNKVIYTFAVAIVFITVACGDENPTSFYAESSSSEAPLSSSTIKQSSSSDIIESSSSFDAISSTTEISSSSWPQYSYGELIDERDGQIYKTIKIGNQTWMAENLNFAYSLPTSKKDSSNNKKTESKEIYGKLYRWSIAMDSAAVFSLDGKGCGKGVNCGSQPSKGVRGVCPENWHIPNETDTKNIIDNSNESYDKLIWLEHYWFLTENEDNEFKTEMKLRYEDFWTSAQIDSENAKGLCFGNNKILTSNSSKGLAYPVRCVKDDEKFHVEHGELKDERDGQVYKTVKIGDQWWMAENLNFVDTQNTENFKSSCYNNEPDSCTKYGKLYRWRTAMAGRTPNLNDYDFKARGICPEKWHVPSFNEWKTLVDIVNNFATDLKSKDGWFDDGNGADSFGFNVLPSGYRSPWLDSEWGSLGELACFWTTLPWSDLLMSTTTVVGAFSACFSSDRKDIFFYYDDDEEPILTDYDEAPLRCVKDE